MNISTTGVGVTLLAMVTLYRQDLALFGQLANDMRFVVTKLGEDDKEEAERLPARLTDLEAAEARIAERRIILDLFEEYGEVLRAPGDDAEARIADIMRRINELADA